MVLVLYNMAGNVSEWVADVYRPLHIDLMHDDVAHFVVINIRRCYIEIHNGEAEIDETWVSVKMADVTDEESMIRRNYQRGNVINFLDGDSLSQSNYGYGVTTLVSDKSRVYKGGSWN